MAIHGWLFFLLSFFFVGICECDVMFLHVDLFEYKYIYHHRIPKNIYIYIYIYSGGKSTKILYSSKNTITLNFT